MNSHKTVRFTVALLALSIAGVVGAQNTGQFPDTQVSKATCADFQWNADMAREHPRVVGACQEVVVVNGVTWARLAAGFTSVDRDGTVNFNIHDQHNRFVEKVTIEPRPGQVAYINDRATPFNRLNTTDRINLYVPEGQYGYATRPAMEDEVAFAAPVTQQPDTTATSDTALASNDAPPAMLPQTASKVPLLALGGLLALLGGLILSMRRWR